MPPSEATSQYPLPSGVDAIPTTGLWRVRAPVEPKNAASPKLKMPPSDATSQYPLPSGVDAIPTTGLWRVRAPVEPKNAASPMLKMPPSVATSQYPMPSGVDAIPTMGTLSGPSWPDVVAPPKPRTSPFAETVQYHPVPLQRTPWIEAEPHDPGRRFPQSPGCLQEGQQPATATMKQSSSARRLLPLPGLNPLVWQPRTLDAAEMTCPREALD